MINPGCPSPLTVSADDCARSHLGDRPGARSTQGSSAWPILPGSSGTPRTSQAVAHEAHRAGERRHRAPVASPAHWSGRGSQRKASWTRDAWRPSDGYSSADLPAFVPGDGHRWYCPATTRSPLCASGGFHACNPRSFAIRVRMRRRSSLDLRLTGPLETDTRRPRRGHRPDGTWISPQLADAAAGTV